MIGPTFIAELQSAGLLGLPFSWGDDGQFEFDGSLTQAQKDAVLAVYAAHDPAAAIVPQSVSRFQGRMALYQENMLADVEAIIASANQPTRIAYEAGTWERGSQFVADMAAMLSLTSTRVDNLFILAGSL